MRAEAGLLGSSVPFAQDASARFAAAEARCPCCSEPFRADELVRRRDG